MNKNSDLAGWAQAVLNLINLVFLVLDTTGIEKDCDIIRILLMDSQGKTFYHRIIQPVRHAGEANTLYTGLIPEILDEALPLKDVWNEVQRALTGKFVLCYGWDFVQERLHNNADFYGLPRIYLIGECMQQTSVQYFRSSGAGFNGYNLKLIDACARIGHTMPDMPLAIERAQGQLALLKAMASGVTGFQPRRFFVEELSEPEELDENLF